MKIKLLAFIWLVSISAWAQTEHGTIVVAFGLSDGYIALAADSMAIVGNGDPKSVCKITTVNDKLVVSATGTTGHIATTGKWDFSVLASAHEVSARLSTNKVALNNFTSLFAKAWAIKVVDKFNHELRVRPKETTASSEGDVLANGIVLGLDKKGILGLSVIKWHYKTLTNGQKTAFQTMDHASDWPVYLAAGDNAIANETFYGTTERAKQWRQELQSASKQLPTAQQNTYVARGLVDLTIHHLPPKTIGVRVMPTVGPPIDSITIDRTGRIEWGEHKPECH